MQLTPPSTPTTPPSTSGPCSAKSPTRSTFVALEIPIATYAESNADAGVVVGYCAPLPAPTGTVIVGPPEVTAVCGLHLGAMTGICASWQSLHRWIADNGYEFDNPCREL